MKKVNFNIILDYFEQIEKHTKENANELYKLFGNTEEYITQRLDCYSIGDKFKYNKLKYEVLEVDRENELITYKRLGFTFRKAPSGRKLKRYGRFSIASIMDLLLKFD